MSEMFPSPSLIWPSLAGEPKKDECEGYGGLGYGYDYFDCDAQQGFDFCSANTTFRNDAYTTTSHGSCCSLRTPFQNERSQPWLTVNNLTSDLQTCAGTLEPHSAEIAAVRNIFFNCDDIFWRNPHTIMKKVAPDNGLALWGDPEIANARPVRHWLVDEGQDESIEEALARNPYIESDEMNTTNFECGDCSNGWPFPFPKPSTRGFTSGWVKDGQEGIGVNPRVGNAEAGLSCTSVRSDGCSACDENYAYELPFREESQSLTSRFVNQLHSSASDLRAIAVNIEQLISQLRQASISNEQIERYMYQTDEEGWKQITRDVEELKQVTVNLSSKIKAKLGRALILQKQSSEDQLFYT